MTDLLAPEWVSDPHPHLHALRARERVHHSETHGAFVLTRHADVAAAFKCRALSNAPGFRAGDEDPIQRILAWWMEFRDPPEHDRLRGLVQKVFTPRRVEALRPRIEQRVEALLDQLAERGRCDYVEVFAGPLPAAVIAELLGVPLADEAAFKGWSDDIKGLIFGGPRDASRSDRARRGFLALDEYFRGLLDERVRSPRADLLSALARAEESGDALSRDEIVSTAVLLLFAGHETTTNLLGNALVALHRFPEQQTRLVAEPAGIDNAVEEFLRWDGPSKLMVRRVLQPVKLAEREFTPGEVLYLHQQAANRDPEVFEDPDRLDLARANARDHLSFGLGLHFCLGASLARLEARIALGRLLARFPKLRVETDVFEWQATVLSRGLERLPVRVE